MKTLHGSDPQFAHFVGSLQRAQGSNPKVEKLKQILHEFFTSASTSGPASRAAAGPHRHIARAIIFASLRDGVANIASELESMSPLVRARMFIGQGGGKGQKGMKQDEQKGVLADFTSGVCNLLVATCIGEEVGCRFLCRCCLGRLGRLPRPSLSPRHSLVRSMPGPRHSQRGPDCLL